MKAACILLLLPLLGMGDAALGLSLQDVSPTSAAPIAAALQTSAQHRIAAAKQQIKSHPSETQPYVEVALASIIRARETADPTCYDDAGRAVSAGLALAPHDFQVEKAHVALLLATHEFAKAREEATNLNRRTPDDVTTYGYLAEADIALGEYADAEKAAQWMLDLLPDNVPGLLTAAELRELYGDPEGALELLNQAYRETPSTENEELAWIANQIAHVDISSGRLDAASQVLNRAEQLFPMYPATLDNLSSVRMEQHRYAEAAALLRSEQNIAPGATVPAAHVLYQLARAEALAGQRSEADALYAQFEALAKQLLAQPANANRDLIFYYGDHAGNWPQALSVAQREIARRHDVWTLDAYAWALYGNGSFADADTQMQKALAVGVRSSQLFDHAGNIALKLHQPTKAARYLESALQADSASEYALDARRTLATLGATPSATPLPSNDPPAPFVAKADSALASASAGSRIAALPQQQTAPIQTNASSYPTDGLRTVPAALLIPRPTETARIIRTMQAKVASNPTDAKGYAGLGAAFFQLARETGDVENYQLAEQSLTKSLDLVSADITAAAPLATMAEVCMGEHRFTEALTYAQRALALGSGDLSAFAIVGDAYADMGEYEKASIAYSRLQPVSVAGPLDARTAYAQQTRVAYLKFVAGDTEGAIREMGAAVDEGVQARLSGENRAWLYFELGEFLYQAGRLQAAGDAYLAALTIHPGDYRALAGMGKVRASQGEYKKAITLYQSAIAVVPMPIYIAELGDIYQVIGDTQDAEKQYKLVQYIGLLGHINQVLHNRDLALFYADHDRNLKEALALANKEFEVRSDIYTWDALAWALYKNGKYAEAVEAMSHATRLGTKDAMLLFHAGMISAASGDDAQAGRELREAIEINPHFHVLYAKLAVQQLKALHRPAALAASTAAPEAQSRKVPDVQ